MSEAFAIAIDDVRAARAVMAGRLARTPCLPAPKLSSLTGADIVVKYETLHATGSFKERGAVVKLASLTDEERARGVIAMSAGNHAQAVAWHASRMGAPATIVMPEGTPLVKIENTRAHGARVVLHGETLADSQVKARRLAAAESLTFVHPYDDPRIMAGQGVVGLEMIEDHPDLDVIVVPLGGGGLGAGVAVAAKALRPVIEIVGVEAESFASFDNALHGRDRPIGGATLAEGIAVKHVGQLTLPIVRALFAGVVRVDETAIEDAINCFATHQRVMAEGAGAASLAALTSEPARFRGKKVGLILTGGNIDARMLASIMVRALERADRIVTFRMTMSDRPGLLGRIATRVGELGANILEVSHGRLFIDVPAKGVSLDMTVETRDAEHARSMLETLAREGYSPIRLDPRGLGA